jgi:hypothetical protein
MGGGGNVGAGGGGGSCGPYIGPSPSCPRLGGAGPGLLIEALLKFASVAVLNNVNSARSWVGFTDKVDADLRF